MKSSLWEFIRYMKVTTLQKKKYITRVSKINETNDSVYVQLKALKPRSYGVLSNIEVSNGNNFCKVDQKNRIQMQNL